MKKQGFTLIELLVAIAILGILILLGLSSFTSSLAKSRDSKRKNDIRQVGLSVESYFADKGSYPLGDGSGQIVGCSATPVACTWGAPLTDGVTLYMNQLPSDAIAGRRYYYISDGTYFQIYARLENTKDTDIPQNEEGLARIYSDPDVNCGSDSVSVQCNYGVSSTNITTTEGHTMTYE